MATHIMGRLSVRPHDAGGFYIQDRLTGARTQSSWELRIALWLAGTMAPRLAQNTQFQKLPTGGGCTALCAEIGPVYWMITDTEGGNYAPGFDEPVFLGMYDKETGDVKLETEFSNLGDCLDWFRKNAAGEVNWFSENAAGEANSHDPKA